MSRRNVILLVIVLILATIAFIGYLYLRGTGVLQREPGEGTNFIDQYNPFGGGTQKPPTTPPPTDVSGVEPPPEEEVTNAKLKKVSSMPVAGFGLFTKERIKDPAPLTGPKTEFVAAVRYVERATGNIFQTFADKIEERKFSKTVIPKIYEAYFGARAESVVMRYLQTNEETIQTFVSVLPKESLGAEPAAENDITGTFLPENVRDVSISSDGLKMFYLFNLGENAIGTTLNFSDKRRTQIFENAFTEWNSFWPRSSMITLTTKPSFGVLGYMYSLDPVSRKFSQVMGGVSGLTTLTSPDGRIVLYSDSNLFSYIYDISTKNSTLTGVKTLAEKCVWGKNSDVVYCAVPKSLGSGLYPDSWYQGEVSFFDQLWKIDIKTGSTTMLADPGNTVGAEEVDGIKLGLDEGENYLFFVNKKNSLLWEFGLK